MEVNLSVYVRAALVTDCGDGVYRLDIVGQELSQEQRTLLKSLFPHLTEQAYDLLAKEALISAMTDRPDQTDQTKPKGNKLPRPDNMSKPVY